MANIPVERKGGTPWWTWLLALLAIVGLIWLIAELFDTEPDEDDLAVVDDIDMVDDTALGDGNPELLATAIFYEAPDRDTYVGQEVVLDSLRVERVIGDSTFTVSAIDGSLDVPKLMVLSQEPSPGVPGIEGQVDINPGQRLELTGTVMRLDGDPANVLGITQAEADAADAGRVYIRANSVDINEADLENVEVN